ncbi:MAG: chorismate-binding protein [Campylobacterales bacterium]|nr:chorismate-binding protein [Campylobacterales bacterium]
MYFRKLNLDTITPVSIYSKIKELYKNDITFLFESVVNNEQGNFSFIIIGFQERIVHKNQKSYYIDRFNNKKEISENPFVFLREYYKNIDFKKQQDFNKEINVGFTDGFIGYIGYDMVCEFEPKLKKQMLNLKDEFNIPDLDLIRPKIILAYSHKNSQLTIISSLQEMVCEFDNIVIKLKEPQQFLDIQKAIKLDDGKFEFSKEQFFEMIDKSKEMIKSGDVFQILMSNRYTQQIEIDNFSFYRTLRAKNPSPYLFMLEYEDFSIIGSSPEVMIRLQEGEILLRPIAGTRKRGKTLKKDHEMEIELTTDEKEKAEHIMLVDLGRNDVGRVAKKGSVHVSHLMRVEKYSHVMHLVSDVEAELDENHDMFDLFESTFTAGTMTGAPKIRAMELIAEFEGVKRGFYSGAIGYFGFDGNLDSAIAIRTSLIKDNKIYLQAGAGIVADSQNELEYLEVTNKMAALKSAIDELCK